MRRGKISGLVVIVLLSLMTAASYSRNWAWNDKISLWQDTVSKSPRKARAYNNLGEAYHQKKRLKEAIENYNASIALSPYESLDAYSNLASIYINTGQYDLAIQAFTKILFINVNDAIAYANRGNAYCAKGDYGAAVRDYSSALSISPFWGEVFHRRANALVQIKDRSHALEDYRRACAFRIQEACIKADRMTIIQRIHN